MADTITENVEKTTDSDAPVVDSQPVHLSFEEFDFSSVDTGLESMLKSGVHFGHLKSRLHPSMRPFVHLTRNNLNIIDLEKTNEYLERATSFLSGVVRARKPVLFVGMKKHTHGFIRSLAERVGEPFVVDRWLGGTLTNFKVIRDRAKYLSETAEKLEKGEFDMYTKLERLKKSEEVERLEKKMGGIKGLRDLPGALVVADGKEAKLAIREARAMGIPVVAIMDTNADAASVEYPIPGNDDALSSQRLLLGAIGRAVSEAKETAAKESK